MVVASAYHEPTPTSIHEIDVNGKIIPVKTSIDSHPTGASLLCTIFELITSDIATYLRESHESICGHLDLVINTIDNDGCLSFVIENNIGK